MTRAVTDRHTQISRILDRQEVEVTDTRDGVEYRILGIDTTARAIMALDAPLLWCCHIRGPDDVIACADYESALNMSDELNAVSQRINAQFPEHEHVWYAAAPALWPHSATAHAEDLERQRKEQHPTPEPQP